MQGGRRGARIRAALPGWPHLTLPPLVPHLSAYALPASPSRPAGSPAGSFPHTPWWHCERRRRRRCRRFCSHRPHGVLSAASTWLEGRRSALRGDCRLRSTWLYCTVPQACCMTPTSASTSGATPCLARCCWRWRRRRPAVRPSRATCLPLPCVRRLPAHRLGCRPPALCTEPADRFHRRPTAICRPYPCRRVPRRPGASRVWLLCGADPPLLRPHSRLSRQPLAGGPYRGGGGPETRAGEVAGHPW